MTCIAAVMYTGWPPLRGTEGAAPAGWAVPGPAPGRDRPFGTGQARASDRVARGKKGEREQGRFAQQLAMQQTGGAYNGSE